MTMSAKAVSAVSSDMELARGCMARDRDAVRQVTIANNQRLFRAAWSILKDRADAEEAVQAAYLKAFAALDSFDGRASLSTWLTRIVINEALGRLRAGRRRKLRMEKSGVLFMADYSENLMRGSEAPAPDVEVAREQLRRLLEKAIASLPDGFRSVFVLREIEGMSVEETADALDLAANTVKTRLLRARKKLQEMLAPDVHSSLVGAFPFAGADCAAMTERVLAAWFDASRDQG